MIFKKFIFNEAGEWVSAIFGVIGLPDPIDHSKPSPPAPKERTYDDSE